MKKQKSNQNIYRETIPSIEKETSIDGITLIALVITIIVLLILAAVSIATLTGENGILTQAGNSREKTEMADTIEKVKIEIIEVKAENNGTITENELNEIIAKYDKEKKIRDDKEEKYIITEKGYEIKVSDIYTGEIEKGIEKINKEKSYVGYYADFDPTDDKIDGIIYADLAKGNTSSGRWANNNGIYTIPIEENTKDYYISKEAYEEVFGTKDVLSPLGTGKDRFYIMSLTDIGGGTSYDWYSAAYGNMSDYAETTSGDFGMGKINTTKMIAKWNAGEGGYGRQDAGTARKDMWGQIQKEVNNGWFVPSKGEWSAFAQELGITKTNYTNFALKDLYWSSSQKDINNVWIARFSFGYMNDGSVDWRCLCSP